MTVGEIFDALKELTEIEEKLENLYIEQRNLGKKGIMLDDDINYLQTLINVRRGEIIK